MTSVATLEQVIQLINTKTITPDFVDEGILSSILLAQQKNTKESRISSYRILELLTNTKSVDLILRKYHFDVFIIRSLIKDVRSEAERVAAFKLLYVMLDLSHGIEPIPPSIVRAIVSIAGQLDDNLRPIAISILCELALRSPKLVAYCGGLRALLTNVRETEQYGLIIETLMYLFQSIETRPFLRPTMELEEVISHFTDAYTAQGTYDMEKLKISGQIISQVLSTWPGLHYFGMANCQSIYSIIEVLSLPDSKVAVFYFN